MSGPEAQLSLACRRALEAHGIPVSSTETMGVRGPCGVTPGIADLIVLDTLRKRIAFVELRVGKGKLTLAQDLFRRCVAWAHGEFHVWRCVKDAIDWIEED